MSRPRALIIDDEPDIRELLAITVRQMDVDPTTAADLAEARGMLSAHAFDLCLTDMRLPDGDGLELVEWMQGEAPDVPVAVITAHGNVESAVSALKLGAFDFVSKPVDLQVLRKLIGTALRLRGIAAPVASDAEEQLLGESPAMTEVRRMIAKVARSQAPVHISGESGTGKERVARLIHDRAPRAGKPFVPVNCGAIPTELMESEFFGHRKGSFTGAVADEPGLFRTAEGGTLFLDEVADLPLGMQVKLLRAIQEKAVRPIGESREVAVDVRILSASHRDLGKLVDDGHFREDLYYRINVIELHVPPLRERGDDVLLLADHFLRRLGEGGSARLAEDARDKLLRHGFPGNVRELENVLERASTLYDGKLIRAADLKLRSGPEADEDTGTHSLDETLSSTERDAIVQALKQTRYNKTAAARLLGISFRALRYRIKKLGLE